MNCGVQNDCDPAFALLNEYIYNENQTLRIGAVLGLGLAYAGSQRKDVSDLMIYVITDKFSNVLYFMKYPYKLLNNCRIMNSFENV